MYLLVSSLLPWPNIGDIAVHSALKSVMEVFKGLQGYNLPVPLKGIHQIHAAQPQMDGSLVTPRRILCDPLHQDSHGFDPTIVLAFLH